MPLQRGLSLYIATAEKQGANRKLLSGTTQNDIQKNISQGNLYIRLDQA